MHICTHTRSETHVCTHCLPLRRRFKTMRMVSSLSAAWWKPNPRNIPFHVPCKTHLPPGANPPLSECVRLCEQRQEDQKHNFLISFLKSEISQDSTAKLRWCLSNAGNMDYWQPARRKYRDYGRWEIKGVPGCSVGGVWMRRVGAIGK